MKHIRECIDIAEREGAHFSCAENLSKHVRLYFYKDDGWNRFVLTVSKTPSCSNTMANFRADVRRAMR